VQLEVIDPSLCFSIFPIQDPRIVAAVFERYNDWLWDYCSYAPDRLMGLALIPLHDVELGMKEFERAVKKGYRGVCIPCTAPEERPYSDPAYDRFWAAAQEAGTPVTMHIFTSAAPGMGLPPSWGPIHSYALALAAGALTVGTLICSGVAHRYPELKFVATEWETGWVAHWLDRLDHATYRSRSAAAPELDMAPSDYFRRQFYVTFEDDEIGIMTAEQIGVDNMLWGSDFPHHDSIWPNSQKVLAEIFQRVPEDRRAEYRRKMTVDNVTQLYGLGDLLR
jgi:predicted TIM-barrel fold metal-dependent hydrolase